MGQFRRSRWRWGGSAARAVVVCALRALEFGRGGDGDRFTTAPRPGGQWPSVALFHGPFSPFSYRPCSCLSDSLVCTDDDGGRLFSLIPLTVQTPPQTFHTCGLAWWSRFGAEASRMHWIGQVVRYLIKGLSCTWKPTKKSREYNKIRHRLYSHMSSFDHYIWYGFNRAYKIL